MTLLAGNDYPGLAQYVVILIDSHNDNSYFNWQDSRV